MNRVPDGSIFKSSPRWIILLFYSKLDKLSWFVYKSNIEHELNYVSETRLQSATKKGLHWQNSVSMYVVFGLSSRWISLKKPNKLINWLISQQMLLRIIILRLMNMCCATKQFSATKISNRKIKFYHLSDGFVYQKKSQMDIFGRCSWRSMIPMVQKDRKCIPYLQTAVVANIYCPHF